MAGGGVGRRDRTGGGEAVTFAQRLLEDAAEWEARGMLGVAAELRRRALKMAAKA